MGEFELSYFEVNKGKNKTKYLSNQMKGYSKNYKSIERKLKGQKGLGIEKVREQLLILSNKCEYVGNDLEQIEIFLKEAISLTEQADHDAKKILESFSMRKAEHTEKAIRTSIKNILKLVIAPLNVVFDGYPVGKWATSILGLENDLAASDSSDDWAKSIIKFAGKSVLKLGIKSSAIVNWLTEWIYSGVNNFMDKEGNTWDNIRETMAEGVSSGIIALGTAALTAGIIGIAGAFGIATGGVGLAVVGAGASIVVNWASDIISELIYHNEEGFVENFGDTICNWNEQVIGF